MRYKISGPHGGHVLDTDDERQAWVYAKAYRGSIFDSEEKRTGAPEGGHATESIRWDGSAITMPFYDGGGWLGT